MFFNFFFLILHISAAGSFPKPLSAAEERECFQKMREGDKSARAKIIECNMRLVAHIVKKYYQTSDDPDDLISIGSLGLIKAVDSFNPEKSTKLATYASKCIENELLMFFRSKKKTANDVSINDEIDCDKDGNPLSFMDIISEDDNIVEQIYGKMQTEKLSQAISRLDERERSIILLRYGISEPALTQKQTAERLGISRSYVSRLEKKALETLKKSLT